MEEKFKEKLRRAAKDAEVKVAKSVLRWKYQKEGKSPPPGARLEERSRQVATQAHDVITKRGRAIWNELKKVYFERDKPGEQEDSDK